MTSAQTTGRPSGNHDRASVSVTHLDQSALPLPPKKNMGEESHIDMHTVPQLEPRDKMANDIDEMTWPDFIIGWPWVC